MPPAVRTLGMRYTLALAALILAAAVSQARAQDACPTPETLPVTIDGVATLTGSFVRGWGNSMIYWTYVKVQLDRPVTVAGGTADEHCGVVVGSVMRRQGRSTIRTGSRVRVEVTDAQVNRWSTFKVLCVLDDTGCNVSASGLY